MAIQTIRDGSTAVVAVNGRLDAVTAPEYEQTVRKLIENGATRVVVDFDKLDYISSAGLGELILTSKLLQEKNGRLCVANARGNVRSVFDMCGIGKVIGIHGSVAEALAS